MFRLWAIVLLIDVFVIALVAFVLVQNRQRANEEAARVAENYARTLEENFIGLIRRIDVTLLTVADEVARQRSHGGVREAELLEFLSRQNTHIPETLGLRVADANGIVRYAVSGVQMANANISDVPHFIRARDDAHSGLIMEEPVLGRVSGQWVVPVARRLSHPDGSFAGAVVVGVPVDLVINMLGLIDLGPNGSDSLWTRTRLIGRFAKDSFSSTLTGRPLPSPQLKRLIESGEKSTRYHIETPLDGIKRILQVRRVGDYPLYVAVGLADADFLAVWKSDARRIALFAALFVGGSLVLTGLAHVAWRRRERLNDTLHAEETRFRSLFENANDGIFLIRSGDIVECNRRGAEICGLERGELIGRTLVSLSPAQQAPGVRSVDAVQDMVAQAMDGKPQQFEWKLQLADGTIRDVEITLSRLDLYAESYLQAIMRDISERKQAEHQRRLANEALEKERGLLRTLFNTIPDLVWMKDPDGVYLACNPEFERFLGHKEPAIVGRTDHDFVDKETADSFQAHDRAAIAAGGPTSNEAWVTYASDGHRALLHTTKAPMYRENGNLIGVLGIAHDITEQQRIASELERHQSALQALVDEKTQELQSVNRKLLDTQFAMESVGIGIHWVDFMTGRIQGANRHAADMLGYTVDEMLQLTVSDIDPNFPQDAYVRIREHIRAQGHVQIESVERTKQGADIPVEVAIFYQAGQDDASSRLIAFLTDITQRKEYEAALIKAKQEAEVASVAKTAFLANMSHEIRTPLNAITGMTHILRRIGVTAQQADKIDKIENAGNHLLEVINAVLDMSKIEAGKFALAEEPLNLAQLIENVSSMVSARIKSKGLAFRVESGDLPPNLLGDSTRLQQALLNYLTNAIKFTESGTIILRAQTVQETQASSLVRFEVVDTGMGIAPETLPRLFSAFEQADNTITRKYGGTGLGLAITRKIAQVMDGDAGVESRLGEGSTFWLTARLKKAVVAQDVVSSQKATDTEIRIKQEFDGTRILLVEDEPINREVTLSILEGSGLIVDVAEDGLQALEMATETRYALILMDMQMPNMDGLEATRRIRALPHGQPIPVIAMTANAFAEDKVRCFEAGMNDFLSKPVYPETLFAIILHWLRKQS